MILTEPARDKELSVDADFPLKLLAEKSYCLSDIIKELAIPLVSSRKRKNYTDAIQQQKKLKETHTPSNNNQGYFDTSVTKDVTVATRKAPVATMSVPIAAQNTQTQTVSMPTIDNLFTTQRFFQNSKETTKTVSMTTENVPTTVSMATQNCPVAPQNGIMTVSMTTTAPTPIETHDVVMTTESKDLRKELEVHDNDVVKGENRSRIVVNNHILRSGKVTTLKVFHFEMPDTEKKPPKKKRKKKKAKDRPKRGRGRPRKQMPWLLQKKSMEAPVVSENNNEVSNDCSVETQTSKDLSTNVVESGTKNDVTTECSVDKAEFLASSLNDNGIIGDNSDETVVVDVLGFEEHHNDTVDNPSLISELVEDASNDTEGSTKLKIKRGRGRPMKRKNIAHDTLPSKTSEEMSVGIQQRFSLLEHTLPSLPSCSNRVSQATCTSSAAMSLNDSMLKESSEIAVPRDILPTNKRTSSVGTSTECHTTTRKKCHTTIRKPTSRPRKFLLPNDLPTMVSLPVIPSQPPSPSTLSDQSNKMTDDWCDDLPTPTIKFVSDGNLSSGAVFFTHKNTKSSLSKCNETVKNVDAIAEALKDSTGKQSVIGDLSVQTAAWLIDVLGELDIQKKNRLKDIESNIVLEYPKSSYSNSPVSSTCSSPMESTSSRTSTASEESYTSADENPNEFVKEVSPVNIEYTQADVEQVNSSVKYVQPVNERVVLLPHHHNCPESLTEVHASFVDLSWRIVTSSNGGNSTSLSNFHKLVPVCVEMENGACSFLAVPMYSERQVIAKILNTTIPYKQEEVFVFKYPPIVVQSNSYIKNHRRLVLSFEWDRGMVSLMPKGLSALSKSNENTMTYHPFKENIVTVQLPKPLKLPVAGSKVYFGDFKLINNNIEFYVSQLVVVAKSPRPSLPMPAGALAKISESQVHTVKVFGGEKTEDKKPAVKKPAVKKPAVKICFTESSTQTDNKSFRPCYSCGVHINSLRDARHHRQKHTTTNGIKCSECPKIFLNSGRLSIHLSTHKCFVIHNCENCSKTFTIPKMLGEQEILRHLPKLCIHCRGRVKCKKCRLTFKSLETFHDHFIEKHIIPCRICDESFIYKSDLSKHMNVKHEIVV